MSLKFYFDLTPLPPETTTLADVKSGRLESDYWDFTKPVLSDTVLTSIFSTATSDELPDSISSKEVDLIVKNLILACDSTLLIAFPA